MMSQKNELLHGFSRRTSLAIVVSLLAALNSPVFSQTAITGVGIPPTIDGGQILVDFEGVGSPQASPVNLTSIVVNGVTFEMITANKVFVITDNNFANNSSTSLRIFNDVVPSQLKITFPNLVKSFALNYGATDTTWRIEAFSSSGASLGFVDTTGQSTQFTSYAGLNNLSGASYFTLTGSAVTGNAEFFDNLVYVLLSSISANGTLESMRQNSLAIKHAFNLQTAKINQGLSYDCTVYDQKNICVSFAGSKSDGKGFDATTGALIIAHKPTNHFRFGGYIDQSFGSSTSGGLTTKKGNPGFGAFAVWSQNADGSGVQVRAAANVGKVDIETTREAIESAEAGFGKSNIKSEGFSLEVSKDYAINSLWSARPYVGYRKTTNTRAGYTEQSSNDVTAPLTYGRLKQNTETLTAGATFAHTLSAKTTLFLTAGIEHDLKNSIGRYAATWSESDSIDSIDMSSNKTKTRPTVSFALNHDIDKTQRVGLSLTHRKEAFASGSTTSAFLQYSKGF